MNAWLPRASRIPDTGNGAPSPAAGASGRAGLWGMGGAVIVIRAVLSKAAECSMRGRRDQAAHDERRPADTPVRTATNWEGAQGNALRLRRACEPGAAEPPGRPSRGVPAR